MIALIIFLIYSATILNGGYALENGLSRTPPMGWMSWERYRCNVNCDIEPNECINEDLFKRTADLMVSEGYLDAGYEYVIIDDCWLTKERDEQGRLQADPKRFPSGLKSLADYIHSKGLKFGMYEDIGTKTCAGYPGLSGHFEQDAQTFAEWEIDYLKVDGCNNVNMTFKEGYPAFGKALNATGRSIVYSCSWPAYEGINSDYDTIAETCNLWRNYGDIDDSWTSAKNIWNWFATNQDKLIQYHAPGHWNDPDMLIIGNYGLTYDESRAQMAIWAILAAPLLMSTDLATVRPEIKDILQNKDVIAVNQDALGIMGRRVYNVDDVQIWTKPILPILDDSESYAIVIVYQRTTSRPYRLQIKLSALGLDASKYSLKDLFDPEQSPKEPTDTISTYVNPNGVVMYKAEPVQQFVNTHYRQKLRF